MSSLIRERKLSPVELVDAHLRQIEKHNPAINAFILQFPEKARAAAKEAELAQMRGQFSGPLHGIPITIKDSFDIAGLPTTCGSRFFAGLKANSDAAAVRRFRQSGAVIMGKTNCPEFLSNYESDNHIIGRTNNPWNLERTSGGSSGGESAAIASFCSAGGIGSDGGGSIRVPAHYCGIAGLKPTPGRISAAGHVPEIRHPGGLLGVAGPMARTVADVRMLFAVLAGYDTDDPFSVPVPLREPELAGLHDGSHKIGVMTQFNKVPVEPSVRKAVQKAATLLETAGFPVEPFMPAGLERAPNIWWFFFGQLPARMTRDLIAGHEEDAHWTGTEFLTQALTEAEPTVDSLLLNLAARDRMRATLLRQMEKYPVLLLPPCGVVAPRHRQRKWETGEKTIGLFEAMMPATPFNLLGLPGLVIPFALTDDGLPVGIQLVGRPYEEELLLAVAECIEHARGPFPAPPGY